MKTENSVLMKQAREALVGKWGLAIGAFVIYVVIIGAGQSIPKSGGVIALLIGGPMCLGLSIFSLALSRNQNPKIDQVFDGFKRFSTALFAYLLYVLFIFLWALLLIIPGIIAGLSYSMMFYIIADDLSVTPKEAMNRSKKMMYSNKWKLFCLHWRFFGWGILSILTLGIGFLWLIPYINISIAKFYDDIKNNANPTVV